MHTGEPTTQLAPTTEKEIEEQQQNLERLRFLADFLFPEPSPRAIEEIAEALQQRWLEYRKATGTLNIRDPAANSWENLPDDLKEFRREQVGRIFRSIHAVGFGLRMVKSGATAKIVELPEAVLYRLGEIEHELWVSERIAAGWRYGPQKDPARREHPMLVPWHQMPDEAKRYDIDWARDYSRLLASAGYEIVT